MSATIESLPPPIARLGELGMLAVLRGNEPLQVVEAASVLIEAGIDVLEITFTVPDCLSVLAEVKRRHPNATAGVGTVTTAEQVSAAVEAGSDFLVSPGAPPRLLSALAGCSAAFLPGVLTPTEVMAALDVGAVGVKLFPGALAGPSGLKALRGPFPDLLVVPTGGVSPSNVAHWRAAGAFAVGAGSDLAPESAVDSGDHDRVRANAAAWLDALARASATENPVSEGNPHDR
jgi:2-dehydro-3-deoxyphosphogluconate aldolase/(4S)-4-hydroxy-2-oxoglutarate aldolase